VSDFSLLSCGQSDSRQLPFSRIFFVWHSPWQSWISVTSLSRIFTRFAYRAFFAAICCHVLFFCGNLCLRPLPLPRTPTPPSASVSELLEISIISRTFTYLGIMRPTLAMWLSTASMVTRLLYAIASSLFTYVAIAPQPSFAFLRAFILLSTHFSLGGLRTCRTDRPQCRCTSGAFPTYRSATD